jgi:hypothetical protein
VTDNSGDDVQYDGLPKIRVYVEDLHTTQAPGIIAAPDLTDDETSTE